MIDQALLELRPNASWSLNGDIYEGLTWLDEVQSKPTEQEIADKVAELKAEYTNKQYQRDRKKAYPSIEDQLDTLYHGGYDAWKQSIMDIKNKHPKP
jgi:hypothetical protein